MIKQLILIATLISSLGAPVLAQTWSDLPYAADTLKGHTLDIYLPEVGEAPYPVIVVIAGSAFFGNDTKKRAFEKMGPSLLEAGYAVVAINHRSSREAIFPALINDVKAAIRFVRANEATYQLDASRIGIAGDSSGGHLSAMMGTSRYVNEYEIGRATHVH